VVASGGNERGARVARSPRLPQLLERIGRGADVVILDTPPALATVEMAELSRTVVDAVLVVVRHGRVTRRSLVSLQRQAEGWRSEILGAVLVDAPPEEDDYYYYKS
jgi:Mrp family chromosome partitioning ATPase